MHAMCVAMDVAGTDNRFYSSHSERHVFSPHPVPHWKLEMLHGLHIKNTLIKYCYFYFQGVKDCSVYSLHVIQIVKYPIVIGIFT